ncbi:MAG: NosD domain-containing protein [Candidatus Bathyarchaeia archaeon]
MKIFSPKNSPPLIALGITFFLFLFSLSLAKATDPLCIEPYDDMIVYEDTVFCSGNYEIYDDENNGIIFVYGTANLYFAGTNITTNAPAVVIVYSDNTNITSAVEGYGLITNSSIAVAILDGDNVYVDKVYCYDGLDFGCISLWFLESKTVIVGDVYSRYSRSAIRFESSNNVTLNPIGKLVSEESEFGIESIGSENVNIVGGDVSGFNIGVRLQNSNNFHIQGVSSNNNNYGMILENSNYTIVSNSVLENNQVGIELRSSNYNTFSNNMIKDNTHGIIFKDYSSENLIYNNTFNNTQNVWWHEYEYTPNYWNETVGNLWLNPDGKGYSETCSDENSDGICDEPYVMTEEPPNIDYLPLAKEVGQMPPPPPPTCVEPYENMEVYEDTVFCRGTYYLNDEDLDGVIKVNSPNIVLYFNETVIIGNYSGFISSVVSVNADNITITKTPDSSFGLRTEKFMRGVNLDNGGKNSVVEYVVGYNISKIWSDYAESVVWSRHDNVTIRNIEGYYVFEAVDVRGDNNNVENIYCEEQRGWGCVNVFQVGISVNIRNITAKNSDFAVSIPLSENSMLKIDDVNLENTNFLKIEESVFITADLGNINGNYVGVYLHQTNNSIIKSGNLSGFWIGIFLDSSNNNTVEDMEIKDCYGGGIFLLNSFDNVVKNSKIIDSQTGIAFQDSNNNLIYNNTFNNTNNYYLSESSNYWNTTIGNLWLNPDGKGYSETCSDENSDGICDEPYVMTEEPPNIDYLPLAKEVGQMPPPPPPPPPPPEINITDCGVLDQENKTYHLIQDISKDWDNDCIYINADNITLDCGWHTIEGTAKLYQNAVKTNKNGVKIMNCIIKNVWRGIYVENREGVSKNIEIINNIIENNAGWFDLHMTGIRLEGVSESLVENNTIKNFVFGSWNCCPGTTKTLFKDNTFYGNYIGASDAQENFNNSYVNNTLVNNTYCFVIWHSGFGGGGYAYLRNNSFVNCTYAGLRIFSETHRGADNDIDSSNTVDGIPIKHFKNLENEEVSCEGTKELFVVLSRNVSIKGRGCDSSVSALFSEIYVDNIFSKGIMLVFSNASINNVESKNAEFGLLAYNSNTISRDSILTDNEEVDINIQASNVTFVNTSYETEDISKEPVNVYRKWYLITSINVPSNIEIKDKYDNVVYNATEKNIKIELLEYYQNTSAKIYFSPYTINVQKVGYKDYSTSFDLDKNVVLNILLTPLQPKLSGLGLGGIIGGLIIVIAFCLIPFFVLREYLFNFEISFKGMVKIFLVIVSLIAFIMAFAGIVGWL